MVVKKVKCQVLPGYRKEAERDGSVTKAIVLPAMRPDFPK